MNRRSTIKLLAGGGVAAALGGGYFELTKAPDHSHLAIDLTLERLDTMDVSGIETTGSWEVARIFNHLAQSIEFSITGYPVLKSLKFRRTLGSLAFVISQSKGRMTHGLDEVIPGEVVDNTADPFAAHSRLLNALKVFDSYDGQIMPHFAYGELSKDNYAIAHVMHINNHLEEFRV